MRAPVPALPAVAGTCDAAMTLQAGVAALPAAALPRAKALWHSTHLF